jgi:filamentous hemagglutinin family protein
LLAWSVAACFAAPPVWALPTGAQVAAGAASFNQIGNSLTVANTPGAIINWNAFSIGALEAVRFDQQNSLSAVLNRVTGGSASAIHGALSSNGRVFLINPNGILFGAGSRIDVNGLIASTLNISDQDFRAGRLNFTAGETAGALHNAGTLQSSPGGNIYLIAPDIENSGIVRAPGGEVLLAAGRQVSLVDGAHPDIQVVVSAPSDKAVNLGAIAAGKVSVFGALLAQRGTVSADTVETDSAGRIVFRASKQLDVGTGSRTTANGATGGTVVLQSAGDTYVSGTVEATGSRGQGGTIAALGERVAVMDQAALDASGETGGGRVMVGGDYQGRNPEVQNAAITYFGPDATLRADARKVGAGGTVIVWADDTTRAHGSISARGGSQGGDGGFVEVSGKQHLDFHASLDLAAPKGVGGTLLLDPADVIVADSRTTENAASQSGGDPNTFTPSTDPTLVTWSDIDAAFLAGATSIAITATGGATDSGNIDIQTSSFNQIGNAGIGETLSFLATNNVSLTGSGKIELFGANAKLVAGWNSGSGVSAPTVVANTGSINVGGAGIATSGGASNGGTVSLIAGQNVATTAAISTGGGNLVINAGGTVTLGAQLSTTPSLNAPGGNITIQAGGNIDSATATTPITATAGNSDTPRTGGTVNISSTTGNISLYIVSAKGSDALTGDNLGGNGGAVTITATSGDVSFSGASNGIFSQGGSSSGVGISGTGGTVNISGANMSLGGIDVSGGTGSVAAYGGASGAINVNATGAVTANGYITASSPSNILSGGNIGIKGASLSFTDATSDVMTNNTGTITLETTSGAISQPAYSTGAIIQGPKLVFKSAGGIYGTGPTNSTSLMFMTSNLDVLNASGEVNMYGGSAISFQDVNSDGYALKLDGTTNAGFSTNMSTNSITIPTTASGNVSLGSSNLKLQADSAASINISQPLTTGGVLSFGTGLINIASNLTAKSVEFNNSNGIGGAGIVTANGAATSDGIAFRYTSGAILLASSGGVPINTTDIGSRFIANYYEFDAGSGAVTISNDILLPTATTLLSFEGSTININASVSGKSVMFNADNVSFSGTPTLTSGALGSVAFAPYTISRPIVIAATDPTNSLWLTAADLNSKIVGNLQLGMTDSAGTGAMNSGAITIGTALTGNSATFKNLALVSSGNITQSGVPIALPSGVDSGGLKIVGGGGSVTLTDSGNSVDYLTARMVGGDLSFNNNKTLSVGEIKTVSGDVLLSTSMGNIVLTAPGIDACYGMTADCGGIVTLSANGSISSPLIRAVSVNLYTTTGDVLDADGSLNNIVSGNDGGSVQLHYEVAGNISIDAWGATIVDSGSPNYTPSSAVGTTAIRLTQPAAPPPVSPPPTIDACVANPALTGCSTVLPTLDACVANPTAAGCAAVLPTIDACVTDPTAAGCSAVLPTLDACVTNPAAPGCTAVLPTVSACVANPTAAGCSVVLPPLDVCITTPSAAGCSAVLPTISTCVANPTATGCSAVLPTLDACVTNPAAPGCTAVLPTVSACVANPTAAGCSAVLPTIGTCVTNPAAPGCSVVLPTLDACVTNPGAAGCAAVLPTLDACVTNPAATGCAVVLPPLATCTTAPTTPGCSVVLPPPTLPTDQQLACLMNPAACVPGGTLPPTDTAQPIIQQVQSSEQQLVLNSQTGQSSSGRPDLTLSSGGSGGGGGSPGPTGSGSGTGQSSSSGEGNGNGEGEGEQTGQNTPNNQQGANNAPTQPRYCN